MTIEIAKIQFIFKKTGAYLSKASTFWMLYY